MTQPKQKIVTRFVAVPAQDPPFNAPPRNRPRKELDSDQVIKLAALGCTVREIATFFEVTTETILRHYKAEVELGALDVKISLKRAQLESALVDKNIQMQIWLGKVLLGQRDHTVTTIATTTEQEEAIKQLTPAELNEQLMIIAEHIGARTRIRDISPPNGEETQSDE